MLTNPAVKAYAAIGDAQPRTKEVKPVEKSNGLLSRSKSIMSNNSSTEKEPNDMIRDYVLQIRNKRKELRNG
tara:strand:+ start:638 stop:853 length:216 start_codon:yes stop_codon:yes gene_type:complete